MEPYTGAKGGFELRSKVLLPVEHAEFAERVKGKSEFTRRRFRIQREDLETPGYTAGCPGCGAVNTGTTAANHSEECRKGLQKDSREVGDGRSPRETERLSEHLEEEESKKKKAVESVGRVRRPEG